MRVIAGLAKGRTLKAPKGLSVRPTSDKVRGAIFNIVVANWGDLEGARVLDIYAGSGALGIEALSRGAKSAMFVEKDRRAVNAIEANLDTCGFKGTVISRDAERLDLSTLGTFDIVFADPPYEMTATSKAVATLASALSPRALAIVEHAKGEAPAIPRGLVPVDSREYGSTAVTFYRRANEEE